MRTGGYARNADPTPIPHPKDTILVPLTTPTLTVSDRAAATANVDVLVVCVSRSSPAPALAAGHGLPREAVAQLEATITGLGVKGAPDELVSLAGVPGVRAARVVLVGLGDRAGSDLGPEQLRRAVGSAVRSLTSVRKAAVCVPAGSVGLVAAAAEGAALGGYAVTGPRGVGSAAVPVQSVTLLTTGARDAAVRRAVKRATTIGVATAWCRDLVNAPPNLLYPETFVEQVRDRAKGCGVRVRVLDENALARGGFGGIAGVGQGSARPPRLATMTYAPAGAKASIALVGKGITFDSGGLCLKPPASMLTMKSDMAGAAAVAATVLAVAELRLPVAVTGYLALAENMPGSNAQRPGDVVTMRGGRTVEIIDTDAEGRMVLGDALALASEKYPDAIVDIATLTGAQVLSLGHRIAAVMANDEDLRGALQTAADSAGEQLWPMPLPEEMRPSLDSQVADLSHKGDRMGGMLTAGLFLREFVGSRRGDAGAPIPWAHLDIAGPSFNDSGAYGYTPKGGTGYGVRTMLSLVEGYART